MLHTVTKTVKINVFCSFKMLWEKSENNICEREIVERSDCSEWIHRMCERTPDGVFYKKEKLKIRLVVLSVLIKKS